MTVSAEPGSSSDSDFDHSELRSRRVRVPPALFPDRPNLPHGLRCDFKPLLPDVRLRGEARERLETYKGSRALQGQHYEDSARGEGETREEVFKTEEPLPAEIVCNTQAVRKWR